MPQPLSPFQAPQIGEAQRRFWLIIDAMLAALVVLALVGGWAYTQVRGSLREVRAAGLVSLLDAETRLLQLWIDEKQRDAERWASTPEVQREAAALARRAGEGTVCATVPQRTLQGLIAPYAAGEELSVFNLIDPAGRIISSSRGEYCGREVSAAFRTRLAPVFAGRTVFAPPWREADRVAGLEGGARDAVLTWVETPVRAADGSVVAALGFGRLAAERFTKLLALATSGTSRDAFAFDEHGRLVTDTRYAAAAAFGSPLASDLVTAALAREEGNEGVRIEPYRSYRGAEVIGAWRWLDAPRIAVAVEVEAAEAYGPLRFLQVAFGVLLVLVLVSMTAAASTSLWAVRARMREARQLGDYRIERTLGEGGMSDVYFARHVHLKRPAAVKVLKPYLATDEAVTRFRREAQLCSQLSHPNTVEIYDYGTTRDGRWYYAMEYLRGISLEDLVKCDGALPVARAAHALRQACGSLEEAHGRGWVHRDVKPGNLMLCARGGEHDVVKVLDFGLVKQGRDERTHDITQYSRILGTPLYMAPERLRDPADADARADIYALGAVAYFALTGRPAFEAATDHDIVYRVMNEPAPSLEGVAGVPAELAQVVARCLEKDRTARPADIAALRRVLDEVARQAPWTEADARRWWSERAGECGVPQESA